MILDQGLDQASTDGLASICPPVHHRPHFYIFNGPSSESAHDMDGLSSSTVHRRPSRTNDHGLSSEFVHEVDGLSSSGRPAVHPCPYMENNQGLSSNSVHDQKFVRICPWDGRSEPKFLSVVDIDRWTGGRSADGSLRPLRPCLDMVSPVLLAKPIYWPSLWFLIERP